MGDIVAYLSSEFHNERVESAAGLVLERLTAIAKSGPEAAMSEILGISVGIARFQQRAPSRRQSFSARALGDPPAGRRNNEPVRRDSETVRPQVSAEELAGKTPSKVRLGKADLKALRFIISTLECTHAEVAAAVGTISETSVPQYVSRIRGQLRLYHIEIEGVPPRAYRMTPEMAAKAKALLSAE